MSAEVRCGHCGYWLGESSTPLLKVEVVGSGFDAKVTPPRDLRLCKKCGNVTVFIPRADLDVHRASSVA